MRIEQRPSRGGRLLRHVLTLVLAAAIAGLVGWGFLAGRDETARENELDTPVKAPSRVAELDGQSAVKLDAQTLKASGIAVAALAPTPYQDQVRGYGTVLDVTPLTELNNSYTVARAQLVMGQAKLAASKTASDRARGLYRDQQNVSLAQFQAADAAARADQAAVAATDSQVRTLAATAAQSFGPVIAHALLDGSALVTQLIAQQRFLLQVTLPPGIGLGAPPRTATVQVNDGPPIPVSFVSPATRTDPRIQGVSVLYLVPATSGVLPGMNISVSLPSGNPIDGVTIPPSAIVWWQDRAWIYRQADASTFVRMQIPTNLPAQDGSYVIKSPPGQLHVVTQGAQVLLSEEFRAQLHMDAD